MSPSIRWNLLPATMLVALTAWCCGGGDGVPASGDATAEDTVASSVLRRDTRPRALEARRLIDEGRADLARPLVEALEQELGVEGPLLLARLSFLEGDEASWVADVERARAADPSDPRPYSTAVEIYAALGRIESAQDELRRGVEAAGGLTPELQRSQGILSLVIPGGGSIGLKQLSGALRADADLPFTGRAMGQAHLLAAKRALSEGNKDLALDRIRTSLEYDPRDTDARLMHGNVLLSLNHFVEGLDILEALHAEGEPVQAELADKHWSAGFFAYVNGERGAARKHYLRARELGSPLVDKSTSREFLNEEFQAALEHAVTAAREGDDAGLRIRVAEMVGLRGGSAPSARREIATSMLSRAEASLTGGDLDAATGLLDAAVGIDDTIPGASDVSRAIYVAKAIDAIERSEPVLAVAYAEEATRAQPDSALAWHLLGELQHATSDWAAAASSLEKAIAHAEAAEEPLGFDVVLKLAECQHLADRVPDAIATLEQCIRTAGPEDVAHREAAERHLRILKD